MSELAHRLSRGDHGITDRPGRDNAWTGLRAAIEREYVHVPFTETRGGTEAGFRLDPAPSGLPGESWEEGEGPIRLEDRLSLVGVTVRCVADPDPRKMAGAGLLEPSPVG